MFSLQHKDKGSAARAGILQTAHGPVETPVFMPVGTQGTVKAMAPAELKENGNAIILGNTYHLALRPGMEVIGRAGGLHRFMGWDRAILTDSGGYQVFSLSRLRNISKEGVTFQSPIDGSTHFLGPKEAMAYQGTLGSDIAMVLDECTSYPCAYDYACQSLDLSLEWANISRDVHKRSDQLLFGIVQGSVFEDLREKSATELKRTGFDGYAIGGLCVGEPVALARQVMGQVSGLLPQDKPRYMMGLGMPEDLVEAVALGYDMFDCVIPTRNGRKGTLFTWNGRFTVTNARFREDFAPVDAQCACYCCRNFTRAYLCHLFRSEEILGMRLASLHNLHFYHRLMLGMREAIVEGRFAQFKEDFFKNYLNTNAMCS